MYCMHSRAEDRFERGCGIYWCGRETCIQLTHLPWVCAPLILHGHTGRVICVDQSRLQIDMMGVRGVSKCFLRPGWDLWCERDEARWLLNFAVDLAFRVVINEDEWFWKPEGFWEGKKREPGRIGLFPLRMRDKRKEKQYFSKYSWKCWIHLYSWEQKLFLCDSFLIFYLST